MNKANMSGQIEEQAQWPRVVATKSMLNISGLRHGYAAALGG